jgi:hypothetical protein
MLLLCGFAGWASRHWPMLLPLAIRKRTGDALWASCIFFLITTVRPRWSTTRAAGLALAIAFTIEFGQIYHSSPWLENLRKTLFGRLVLGSGFSWLDQLAYIVGVAAVTPVDWWLLRQSRSNADHGQTRPT